MESSQFFFIFAVLSQATAVVIRGSSNSGEAVIAISSSDPGVEKYFTFSDPSRVNEHFENLGLSAVARTFPADVFDRPFTLVSPGRAIAGTGRGFVSANNFLSSFLMPLELERFGLNNFNGLNWIKRVEDLYDPSYIGNVGNGHVRTVTAVNDNGHVYGEVKTVTVDDKGKSHTVKSELN